MSKNDVHIPNLANDATSMDAMTKILIAMLADGNQGINGAPHNLGFLACFTVNCSRSVANNQTVTVPMGGARKSERGKNDEEKEERNWV